MSRITFWSIAIFCTGAVATMVAALTAGCALATSALAGPLGLALWISALVAALALVAVDVAHGHRRALAGGAVAIVAGGACLVVDLVLARLAPLCGSWQWNV